MVLSWALLGDSAGRIDFYAHAPRTGTCTHTHARARARALAHTVTHTHTHVYTHLGTHAPGRTSKLWKQAAGGSQWTHGLGTGCMEPTRGAHWQVKDCKILGCTRSTCADSGSPVGGTETRQHRTGARGSAEWRWSLAASHVAWISPASLGQPNRPIEGESDPLFWNHCGT